MFTSVILHMNIIFIKQRLLGGNSEILNCPMFLHAVRNFVIQKTFSNKHVSTFFTAKV